ncbi:MAG: response regulator, partial [bacterium]
MSDASIRVLLVEDNADHAFLVKKCLEKGNHQVLIASTWKECQTVLKTAHFDILLLDYNLPNVNGLTILNRLRREQETDIPVVVVTGQGHEEVAVEALHAGAADYVVKNNAFPAFLPKVIARVLDKHDFCKEKERIEAEVFIRNRELQVLNSVSRVVNQSLVLEEILEGALSTVVRELELDGGAILSISATTSDDLSLEACEGVFRDRSRHCQNIVIPSGFLSGLISDSQGNFVLDLEENEAPLPDFLRIAGLRS